MYLLTFNIINNHLHYLRILSFSHSLSKQFSLQMIANPDLSLSVWIIIKQIHDSRSPTFVIVRPQIKPCDAEDEVVVPPLALFDAAVVEPTSLAKTLTKDSPETFRIDYSRPQNYWKKTDSSPRQREPVCSFRVIASSGGRGDKSEGGSACRYIYVLC